MYYVLVAFANEGNDVITDKGGRLPKFRPPTSGEVARYVRDYLPNASMDDIEVAGQLADGGVVLVVRDAGDLSSDARLAWLSYLGKFSREDLEALIIALRHKGGEK